MNHARGRDSRRILTGARALILSLLGLAVSAVSMPTIASYLEREEVQSFVDQAVSETGVSREQVVT
ncbi:MAG: hypothetical protein ABR580_13025, partial [Halomonas sp.]